MSLLCSGVLETPCLAVRVMIYSNGEYIPVIKCTGYKQNHGADPDLLPPPLKLLHVHIGSSTRSVPSHLDDKWKRSTSAGGTMPVACWNMTSLRRYVRLTARRRTIAAISGTLLRFPKMVRVGNPFCLS